MENLSQLDPRWAKMLLGNSTTSTIKRYGCKLTSLAMMAYKKPPEVNEILKKAGAFNVDLISDTRAAKALGMKYDGVLARSALPEKPCIVEVDYNKFLSGKQQHFAVWLGFKNSQGQWMIKDPLSPPNSMNIPLPKKYDIISFRMFHEMKPNPHA